MAEIIKVDGQHNGLLDGIDVGGVNALMGTFGLPADHFVTSQSERPGFVVIGHKMQSGNVPCVIDYSIEVRVNTPNFVSDNVIEGNYYKPHKT